jgi:hypothetical protein
VLTLPIRLRRIAISINTSKLPERQPPLASVVEYRENINRASAGGRISG